MKPLLLIRATTQSEGFMPVAPQQHRAYPQRNRDADRPCSTQRGYDHDWRRLRAQHLARHPLCVECEKQGIINAGTADKPNHVDHIVRHNGIGCPLRLDPSNLQTLCHSCHSRKTAMEMQVRENDERWVSASMYH
jgi:5-methylcytosine-specific restriction endonuclease McrA